MFSVSEYTNKPPVLLVTVRELSGQTDAHLNWDVFMDVSITFVHCRQVLEVWRAFRRPQNSSLWFGLFKKKKKKNSSLRERLCLYRTAVLVLDFKWWLISYSDSQDYHRQCRAPGSAFGTFIFVLLTTRVCILVYLFFFFFYFIFDLFNFCFLIKSFVMTNNNCYYYCFSTTKEKYLFINYFEKWKCSYQLYNLNKCWFSRVSNFLIRQ